MIRYFLLQSLFAIIILSRQSMVLAASCSATKPEKAPELFQIDVTKTTAKLFFTPITKDVTSYTILYGLERGRDDYGVNFPFGPYDGVIDYTINALSPNTKYYFRVRVDNGCRQGLRSDTMSATTDKDFKRYTKVKGITTQKANTELVLNYPTLTPSPIPTETQFLKASPTKVPKVSLKNKPAFSLLGFISSLFSKLKSLIK